LGNAQYFKQCNLVTFSYSMLLKTSLFSMCLSRVCTPR